MNSRRLLAVVLLALLAGAIYGLVRTRAVSEGPGTSKKGNQGPAAQAPLVDQTPFETAQRLAQMPISAEELPFAKEALRLGDQEMDLAFAEALRDATEHPPVLSAEALDNVERLITRRRSDLVKAPEL